MVEIREIKTTEDYTNLLKENKCVLKFSAEWCYPCKSLSQTIKNLEDESVSDIVFGEINIDEEFAEDIVSLYNIRGVPVLLFFKDGELVNRTIGNIPATKVLTIINESFK